MGYPGTGACRFNAHLVLIVVELDSEGLVSIQARLFEVRTHISQAASRAGRDASEVTLLAVSKTKPMEDIVAAYAAGQRAFGENRLEELWQKVEAARELGLDEIRWHMIGSIQSRKTSLTVGPFELVHSVDRMKIVIRMSRDALEAETITEVLLEVNVSGEESKHGFSPAELRKEVAEIVTLPGIRVHGLMTMAPIVDDPEKVRSYFAQLRALRDELANQYSSVDWSELSMGMTQDYEVAVEEGATIVRVGSAIFGERNHI